MTLGIEMKHLRIGFVVFFASFCGQLAAEVEGVTHHGFISVITIEINAAPDRVYEALTDEIHLWWDASHSHSLDAKNFTLDARPGGCLCESFPEGGGVEHMYVEFAQPGKRLYMRGGLGPLQTMAVRGSMTVDLKASAEATILNYRYKVEGHGLKELSAKVDAVQHNQLRRLKHFVEHGTPLPADT